MLCSQCAWLLLIAAPLAAAQEAPAPSDTTPFRRGQWAAQFGGGFSLATLGLLRFTSSRSAWLLDARTSGGHSHSTFIYYPTGSGDTTINGFSSDASVSLRAGRRFYRSASREIMSFVSLGLLGGFTHAAQGYGTEATEGNGWNAGVFGELGGTYLFNHHFGIGLTADVTAAYSRSTFKTTYDPSSRTTWSYSVSAPNLRFVATLFF